MVRERSRVTGVALRVEVLVAALARPRRQEEQQPRVGFRAHLVALVRIEVREEPRPRARRRAVLGDLDLAVVDVQPGVLVDLVVLEHLARREVDGDGPRGAVVAAQDRGAVGLDSQLGDVPRVHGPRPYPVRANRYGPAP